MDLILNGQAHGAVAQKLLQNGFNLGVLRPWIGDDGRTYVTDVRNGKMVSVLAQNVTATLRKNEWIELDTAVISAAKERLRVVTDIRAAGLTYTIPNGMGKTVLESQTMGDITPATISMDPARQSEGDRPEFDLTNLPLPVIHKDFFYNARQVATSRNSGAPIDTTTAQLASRRVAEEIEKLTLGVSDSFTYAGGTVYGFVNFPHRLTMELTDPATSGWTPAVLISEILEMRQKSTDTFYFGPWVLYFSTYWSRYLDEDYSTLKGDLTLRERIAKIDGVSAVRTADFLPGKQIVMVQMTSDVVRMVLGMDITTLQWESMGGLRLDFKVMAIIVPQLRAVSTAVNGFGTSGIIHGVAT